MVLARVVGTIRLLAFEDRSGLLLDRLLDGIAEGAVVVLEPRALALLGVGHSIVGYVAEVVALDRLVGGIALSHRGTLLAGVLARGLPALRGGVVRVVGEVVGPLALAGGGLVAILITLAGSRLGIVTVFVALAVALTTGTFAVFVGLVAFAAGALAVLVVAVLVVAVLALALTAFAGLVAIFGLVAFAATAGAVEVFGIPAFPLRTRTLFGVLQLLVTVFRLVAGLDLNFLLMAADRAGHDTDALDLAAVSVALGTYHQLVGGSAARLALLLAVALLAVLGLVTVLLVLVLLARLLDEDHQSVHCHPQAAEVVGAAQADGFLQHGSERASGDHLDGIGVGLDVALPCDLLGAGLVAEPLVSEGTRDDGQSATLHGLGRSPSLHGVTASVHEAVLLLVEDEVLKVGHLRGSTGELHAAQPLDADVFDDVRPVLEDAVDRSPVRDLGPAGEDELAHLTHGEGAAAGVQRVPRFVVAPAGQRHRRADGKLVRGVGDDDFTEFDDFVVGLIDPRTHVVFGGDAGGIVLPPFAHVEGEDAGSPTVHVEKRSASAGHLGCPLQQHRLHSRFVCLAIDVAPDGGVLDAGGKGGH